MEHTTVNGAIGLIYAGLYGLALQVLIDDDMADSPLAHLCRLMLADQSK